VADFVVHFRQEAAMRDSFETYFTGWNLDPDEPAEVRAEFAVLVTAVGHFVTTDETAAAAWHAFPLDGKKECFFHFAKKAREAGVLPEATRPIMERLKADYPRSFG